jgi:plasmid stabilization system protein ParE
MIPRKFTVLSEAELHLEEVFNWYEDRSPGLGDLFLNAVDYAFATIQDQPFAYQRIFSEVRRCVLRRFPYCLFYTVTEETIIVLACFHGTRNPRRWKRLLE